MGKLSFTLIIFSCFLPLNLNKVTVCYRHKSGSQNKIFSYSLYYIHLERLFSCGSHQLNQPVNQLKMLIQWLPLESFNKINLVVHEIFSLQTDTSIHTYGQTLLPSKVHDNDMFPLLKGKNTLLHKWCTSFPYDLIFHLHRCSMRHYLVD